MTQTTPRIIIMAVAALAGSTAAMAQRHDGGGRDHGNDRGSYQRGGQQGNWGGRNDRGDRGYERRDDRRWNDRPRHDGSVHILHRGDRGYGYQRQFDPYYYNGYQMGYIGQDYNGRPVCITPANSRAYYQFTQQYDGSCTPF